MWFSKPNQNGNFKAGNFKTLVNKVVKIKDYFGVKWTNQRCLSTAMF